MLLTQPFILKQKERSDTVVKGLEKVLVEQITDMKVNDITPCDTEIHSVYLDKTEKDNTKWLELITVNKEGRSFKGCLYFGLMLTPNGPKVIEYNCRFGDPETQVVLPLLESDLLTVMQACTNGTLAETEVKFADKHACCVVTASGGYPESYPKGYEITMTAEAAAHTYVAGAKLADGKLVTSGGRVTGTTAVAESLSGAVKEAYRLADGVQFTNAYRRSDIGKRALDAVK